jgi:hypothetical protein
VGKGEKQRVLKYNIFMGEIPRQNPFEQGYTLENERLK